MDRRGIMHCLKLQNWCILSPVGSSNKHSTNVCCMQILLVCNSAEKYAERVCMYTWQASCIELRNVVLRVYVKVITAGIEKISSSTEFSGQLNTSYSNEQDLHRFYEQVSSHLIPSFPFLNFVVTEYFVRISFTKHINVLLFHLSIISRRCYEEIQIIEILSNAPSNQPVIRARNAFENNSCFDYFQFAASVNSGKKDANYRYNAALRTILKQGMKEERDSEDIR